MEEQILIENIRWYPTATADQMLSLTEAMVQQNSRELLLMPDPSNDMFFKGIVLTKYYTPSLSQSTGVRGTNQEGKLCYLTISSIAIRGFLNSITRKMQGFTPRSQRPASETVTIDELLELEVPGTEQQDTVRTTQSHPILEFLKRNTPAQIEAALNNHIIGQPDLTRSVADFLYYHALRQLHPQLPQRPLLISGPSGSGKTEVWRVASKLYSGLFPIKIIDGSSLTCEGWAGNYKLDTFMDSRFVQGGILVVDEFDKLTKPKHTSGGDNVSLDMQAEFLKLMEGEYQVTEKKKQTNMTSKHMGFALVGAFESLRAEKAQEQLAPVAPIGFCAQAPQEEKRPERNTLTDEDFIRYGIMPEIVGRIATRCTTSPLSEESYIDIIRGEHSRVALIEQVLESYGIRVSDVVSGQELQALIAASKSNHTGVRWVSAQVENRLLSAIREQGLFPQEDCQQEQGLPLSA